MARYNAASFELPIGYSEQIVKGNKRKLYDPVSALVMGGTQLIGGMMGADAQKSAGEDAANAQFRASQMGIEEQRRQFDTLQKLLAPYVQAGTGALSGQQALLGLSGTDAQQQAIAGIQNSPQFSALQQTGTNSILQNASATGGLRGGNTQAALAQFSPQLLSQLIDQQYSRLGGLTSLGQNAAAGTGNAGMATGNNIANLLGQQGSAQAGAALNAGNAQAGLYRGIGSLAGNLMGYSGFGGGFSGGGFGKGGVDYSKLSDLIAGG